MTTCAHCPSPVQSASGGFIHTDTHNRQSDTNGHHAAEPGDAWTPVEDVGVVNPPYPPKRADITGTRLDPWTLMDPYERDRHVQNCEECVLCGPHRVWGFCKTEGTETLVMSDGNCTCGSVVLMGIDFSDMKASEQ